MEPTEKPPMDELHRANLKAPSNMSSLTSCKHKGHALFMVLSNGEEEDQAATITAMRFLPNPPRFLTSDPKFAIPLDAEILSIHLVSLEATNEMVLGITYLHTVADKPRASLSIFGSSMGPLDSSDPMECLRLIADDFRVVQLPFIPYALSHVDVDVPGKSVPAFLISGRDERGCMHLHGVRMADQEALFSAALVEMDTSAVSPDNLERSPTSPLTPSLSSGSNAYLGTGISASLFFPEFRDIPNMVVCRDSVVLPDGRRVTALGCQDGTVQLTTVSPGTLRHGTHHAPADKKPRVLRRQNVRFDGLVTSVKLFSHRSGPATLSDTDDLHLLVTCGVESAVVYRSVLTRGLALATLLPGSDGYDSVLCATVADMNWDGHNEVIVGTYGQEVLVFGAPPGALEAPEATGTAAAAAAKTDSPFRPLWQRSFTHPVYAVECCDVTEDGMEELVVLSMFGLHVLQHDLSHAAQRCDAMLTLMDEVAALEKELKTLGK